MINKYLKFRLNKTIAQYKSFLLLISLIILTTTIINFYDKFKYEQSKNLENILNNIYLQKTLKSISSELKPRFEKIDYIINSGESFEGILNEIKLDEVEKKNILNSVIKNKKKIKLYENQKIIFEIDNLNKRKVNKIIIPINKKRDLVISYTKENSFTFNELNKQLTLTHIYKENYIRNSLYKAAIEKNIDPNIIIQFAQIYGFEVDFQRDIRKNDSFQIVYEQFKNSENKTVYFGNILYANLILQGKSLELYFFNSEKDKINDHF